MYQDELRERLSEVTSAGLSAAAISRVIGISKLNISRFKNGQICLIDFEADRLKKYLDATSIPTNV